jgi:hypothetical protein
MEDALELLNLNCERLRKSRQDRYDNINKFIVPILQTEPHLLDAFVAGRLQPNTLGHLNAFWSTERCALGEPAEAWLANNVTKF